MQLINISKLTSRKTKWPRFFGLPGSNKFYLRQGGYAFAFVLFVCLFVC